MSESDALPPHDDRIIRCQSCGEPIAERWDGGGMAILTPRPYIDREGRLVVRCEQCGHLNRLLRPKAA